MSIADTWTSFYDYLEEKGLFADPVPRCEICGHAVIPNPNQPDFDPYFLRVGPEARVTFLDHILDGFKSIFGKPPQLERYTYYHCDCLRQTPEEVTLKVVPDS